MATIKDIAEKTGFSISTVSRVLKQDDTFKVADETRFKIISAAEDLDYIPKKVIHDRLEKPKKTFGLICWYTESEELSDPYYLALRLIIENYAQQQNISIIRLIHNNTFDVDVSKFNLDGLILLGKYSDNEILNYKQAFNNLVLVDCNSDIYDIDVVYSALKSATKQIIHHFIDNGISDISLICGVEETLDKYQLVDKRVTTYKREMRHLGYYDESKLHLGTFSIAYGYEVMSKIIENDKLSKAYIVGSDSIAVGCLRALNEHGIKVPQQTNIISYDNTALSQYTIPSLTSVNMNLKVMGETSIDTLVEKINNKRLVGKKIGISTNIFFRESCLNNK